MSKRISKVFSVTPNKLKNKLLENGRNPNPPTPNSFKKNNEANTSKNSFLHPIKKKVTGEVGINNLQNLQNYSLQGDKESISSDNKRKISSKGRVVKNSNFDTFSSNEGSPKVGAPKKSDKHVRPKKFNKNIRKSYFFKSQAGKNESGLTKINQDSYVSITNVLNMSDFNIFGVLDGHGNNGHYVSSAVNSFFTDFFKKSKNYIIKNELPISVGNPNYYPKSKSKSAPKEFDFDNLSEEYVYDFLRENNYEIIRRSFILAENEISNQKFDANFSGTTGVLVLILNDKIICANAGDSRAILVNEPISYSPSSKKIF